MALPVTIIDKPAALDGQSNGKLPGSILRTVNRVTMLADTSIRAWLAMQAAAVQDGIALAPTSPADTYRTYAQQETLFRSRYQPFFEAGVTTDTYKLWDGGDGGVLERWFLMLDANGDPYATAAVPGKSNHGLALAIDIANAEQPARHAWLLANAARFGWSWELQSEIWHLHYFSGDAIPQAVLDYEQGDDMQADERNWLAELHKLATTGLRTGAANETPPATSQTAGGGIPIAWWPKQFYELDMAVAQIPDPPPAEVDVAALALALTPLLGPMVAQAVRAELNKTKLAEL